MKKVIIAGGTGFIGKYLTTRFLERGYDVMVVSRKPVHIQWNEDELSSAFEKADLVLNLAGKSINCRHNSPNRKAILRSRIDTTTLIGNAIKNCKNPPKLWINASATGVYPPSVQTAMTEESKPGSDFLAEVVKQWEAAFFDFNFEQTRQVALRTSVVLGANGGALKPLLMLAGAGLGGKLASGKQMMSWIHVEDYFNILLFLLTNENVNAVVNCTSPEPLSNKSFMQALRRVLHVPFGLPAPAFAVKLGARLIGTEPELILNSSYVIPKRLNEAGYRFLYPDIDSALEDILN